MFYSFRKNKETKGISMQISQKFKRTAVSLSKNVQIKNISEVVELPKNA